MPSTSSSRWFRRPRSCRHFEGERKTFLQKVLAQARKAKTWFHIDLDQACQAIGAPRDRVVRALDYLAEQKWLELKTAGVRQRYQMRNRPSDLPALVKSLYDRVLQRESREIQRLRQVAQWVEQDACQVAALGRPFRRPDGSALRPLLLVPAGRQAGEAARRGRKPRSIRPSGRR